MEPDLDDVTSLTHKHNALGADQKVWGAQLW